MFVVDYADTTLALKELSGESLTVTVLNIWWFEVIRVVFNANFSNTNISRKGKSSWNCFSLFIRG